MGVSGFSHYVHSFCLFLVFETGTCCGVQAGLELIVGLELSAVLLPEPP